MPSLLGDDDVPANIALARSALHRILIGAADRAGAKIVMNCTVTDLHEDPDGIEVTFTDGRSDGYDTGGRVRRTRSPLRRRLFGDAAHASTPHLTQGTAMAIEDAVVLAECLGKLVPLEQALHNFAERRMPRARFVHERSRASLVNEMVHDKTSTADSYAEVMPRRMAEIDSFLSQPA